MRGRFVNRPQWDLPSAWPSPVYGPWLSWKSWILSGLPWISYSIRRPSFTTSRVVNSVFRWLFEPPLGHALVWGANILRVSSLGLCTFQDLKWQCRPMHPMLTVYSNARSKITIRCCSSKPPGCMALVPMWNSPRQVFLMVGRGSCGQEPMSVWSL